jgi:hypothetical protein
MVVECEPATGCNLESLGSDADFAVILVSAKTDIPGAPLILRSSNAFCRAAEAFDTGVRSHDTQLIAGLRRRFSEVVVALMVSSAAATRARCEALASELFPEDVPVESVLADVLDMWMHHLVRDYGFYVGTVTGRLVSFLTVLKWMLVRSQRLVAETFAQVWSLFQAIRESVTFDEQNCVACVGLLFDYPAELVEANFKELCEFVFETDSEELYQKVISYSQNMDQQLRQRVFSQVKFVNGLNLFEHVDLMSLLQVFEDSENQEFSEAFRRLLLEQEVISGTLLKASLKFLDNHTISKLAERFVQSENPPDPEILKILGDGPAISFEWNSLLTKFPSKPDHNIICFLSRVADHTTLCTEIIRNIPQTELATYSGVILLFFGVCRTQNFLNEFAREVVRCIEFKDFDGSRQLFEAMASAAPNFEDNKWATEVCCKAIKSEFKFEDVAPLSRVAEVARMVEAVFWTINETVLRRRAAELRGIVEYLEPMFDRDAGVVREAMGRTLGRSQERMFALLFPAVYRRVVWKKEEQEELALEGF